MAVIRKYDTSHGVQEHLEHGLGAQAGSDYVGDASNQTIGSEKGGRRQEGR